MSSPRCQTAGSITVSIDFGGYTWVPKGANGSLGGQITIRPYWTVYITPSPLGRFSMVDISTAVGIVRVPKTRSALERSRQELSEGVSSEIGTGTPLIVQESSLAKRPRGV